MNLCKLCYILMILLGSSAILCYPISAFQIKFYGSYTYVQQATSMYGIPDKYFEGIKAIRFYERSNPKYDAWYFNGGVINIMNYNMDKSILVHELAHHQQFVNHKKVNHDNSFYEYEKEITDASN